MRLPDPILLARLGISDTYQSFLPLQQVDYCTIVLFIVKWVIAKKSECCTTLINIQYISKHSDSPGH